MVGSVWLLVTFWRLPYTTFGPIYACGIHCYISGANTPSKSCYTATIYPHFLYGSLSQLCPINIGGVHSNTIWNTIWTTLVRRRGKNCYTATIYPHFFHSLAVI